MKDPNQLEMFPEMVKPTDPYEILKGITEEVEIEVHSIDPDYGGRTRRLWPQGTCKYYLHGEGPDFVRGSCFSCHNLYYTVFNMKNYDSGSLKIVKITMAGEVLYESR